MAKLMIPMALKHSHPKLYELASMMRTQKRADAFIRLADPDWSWSDDGKLPKGTKGDIQAAGSYSLDLCQGGGGNHQASGPGPKRVLGVTQRIKGAVATMDPSKCGKPKDMKRRYPRGTRRLASASRRTAAMWLPAE